MKKNKNDLEKKMTWKKKRGERKEKNRGIGDTLELQ